MGEAILIFGLIVVVSVMVSITVMLRAIMVALVYVGPFNGKLGYCRCTPDHCPCWDIEQKRRRADLDRQAGQPGVETTSQ